MVDAYSIQIEDKKYRVFGTIMLCDKIDYIYFIFSNNNSKYLLSTINTSTLVVPPRLSYCQFLNEF